MLLLVSWYWTCFFIIITRSFGFVDVLTPPNQPQLPESGMYTGTRTHLTKPLLCLLKLSTDGGSLDTSLPVLSDQQTEPSTSVSSEGEVKPDKEESLPTCTPESHCGMWTLCSEDVTNYTSIYSR